MDVQFSAANRLIMSIIQWILVLEMFQLQICTCNYKYYNTFFVISKVKLWKLFTLTSIIYVAAFYDYTKVAIFIPSWSQKASYCLEYINKPLLLKPVDTCSLHVLYCIWCICFNWSLLIMLENRVFKMKLVSSHQF